MESGLKSLSSYSPSPTPFPRPPLLPPPLPARLQGQASPPPQRPSWPASAPIVVAASPSRKRAARQGEVAGWTSVEYSMYSVSPPPSSVPMPTSLLLAAAAGPGREKAPPPTACAVQVVDVGATDELRRLLRL